MKSDKADKDNSIMTSHLYSLIITRTILVMFTTFLGNCITLDFYHTSEALFKSHYEKILLTNHIHQIVWYPDVSFFSIKRYVYMVYLQEPVPFLKRTRQKVENLQ